MNRIFRPIGTLLVPLVIVACAEQPLRLGPHDGLDLPGSDLDRIQVGQEAPDFSLLSFAGDTVTLSDYRQEKIVVLQFYRGHW